MTTATPAAAGGPYREPAPDTIQAVWQLGKRSSIVLLVTLIIALTAHGGASARAFTIPFEMREQIDLMRKELHEFFWATHEVDVVEDKKEKKAEEKEEEAVPEPEEPEPVVPPPDTAPEPEEKPPDDPYDDFEPPPAPMEAPDVLTQDKGPVDLTGDGWEIVDKDGSDSRGYGQVSAAGTAKTATYSRQAKPGGQDGGRGKGDLKPKPKPRKNLSRPAGLSGSTSWSDCPFPPEADQEQVNVATVTITVTVGPNGKALSVRVLSDPGYGFGAAARRCALTKKYAPARNADGQPITSTTPPINVRYRR